MKRPPACKRLLFALLLFASLVSYAQTGHVSGTIEDADGLPLPGVNIVIKGKNTGTQTDFDGNYRIKCDVGDTLVISYIGSKTREVQVTAVMFGKEQVATVVQNVPVETILDTTYRSLVRKNLPVFLSIPNIEESPKTYNNDRYLNASGIKDISIDRDKVKLTYFDSDIYFEVGASSLLGMQFVRDQNLPLLQKVFAQGIPLNGLNLYQGPETSTPFSYGPLVSNLEFDGNNYSFDVNGSLVPLGNGNGKTVTPYENDLFETVVKTSNSLFVAISTDGHFFGFDYLNTSGKDVYGAERSHLDEFTIKFNNSPGYHDFEWDAQVKYVRSLGNQPNINGFLNNLLLNALATPPTFQNSQGNSLQDGTQRSFAPIHYNNPDWLLSNNGNQLDNKVWTAILNSKIRVADNVTLNGKLGYTISDNRQNFGVFRNTIGFSEGYGSNKRLEKDTFDASLGIDWETFGNDVDFGLASSFAYSNENLNYDLIEQFGFEAGTFDNPQSTTHRNRDISQAVFRWFTRMDFRFFENRAKVSLVNNTFTSTKQNSKWLLPSLQLKYEFAKDWHSNFLYKLDLSASYGHDVSYLNLFYANQSHNSLRLLPEESLGYTANNDLFASDAVDLEERKGYEIGLDFGFRLFDENWSLNTVYYSNTTKGSIFPIWEMDQYRLQNVANIRNSGVEWTFDTGIYGPNSNFSFRPKLIFSTYGTKVLNLLVPQERIPIAGFSTISKNLIKGRRAGILVGSRYLRDTQNNVIIDSEGFPLVDNEPGVIGDPTPDFNLGFSSTLKWKGFALDFVLDYQKGGDIWNGTQSVLNYWGTSLQSALERNVTGFVYEGVNEHGEANTIPVDFANPQNGLSGNRFVRYGFDGVGEEAIVDGSYLNFKSFDLSYAIKTDNDKPFFREMRFGVYGLNLFTTAKFRGATPYSNLFDQASSGGLNFFNSPLRSEVGLKINFKI